MRELRILFCGLWTLRFKSSVFKKLSPPRRKGLFDEQNDATTKVNSFPDTAGIYQINTGMAWLCCT
jgi:hypothetical protein